jgi:hypothetical protein
MQAMAKYDILISLPGRDAGVRAYVYLRGHLSHIDFMDFNTYTVDSMPNKGRAAAASVEFTYIKRPAGVPSFAAGHSPFHRHFGLNHNPCNM